MTQDVFFQGHQCPACGLLFPDEADSGVGLCCLGNPGKVGLGRTRHPHTASCLPLQGFGFVDSALKRPLGFFLHKDSPSDPGDTRMNDGFQREWGEGSGWARI